MRRILLSIAALALSVAPAAAQATRSTLESYNNANIRANGQGLITGPIINSMFNQTFNGMGVLGDTNVWTGSSSWANAPNGLSIFNSPNQFQTNILDASLLISRTANYSGGTVGYVKTAMDATCNSGANVTNFEWCGLFRMDNFSTAGNNLALYAQSQREAGAGPTWAATFEHLDKGSGDPTVGNVTIEIDNEGIGTDAHHNRLGLDVWTKCYTALGVNCTSQTFTASYGVRVDTDANSAISNGAFEVNAHAEYGLDCGPGTLASGCIGMADGQPIVFSNTGDRSLYWLSNALDYRVAGNTKFSISDAGAVNLAALTGTAQQLCETNGTIYSHAPGGC